MSSSWSGGKGDSSRVSDASAYRNNFDKIFGGGSTPEPEKNEGIRIHIHVGDPRYPMVCVNGEYNFGLRMDPDTLEVNPDRICICHARSDDTCICDL